RLRSVSRRCLPLLAALALLIPLLSQADAAAGDAAPSGVASVVAPNSAPPSFRQDVMPVFFRAGCNAGSCHGSSRGKDGFMLSLFGYDPKGDYFRITQEMVG